MSDSEKHPIAWRHWALWGFALVQSVVLLMGFEHSIRTESAYSGILAVSSWSLLVAAAQVLSGYSSQLFSRLLDRPPVLRAIGAVKLCLWLPPIQIVATVLMIFVIVSRWPQTYDVGYLDLDETSAPLAIILLLLMAGLFELCGLLVAWLVVAPLQWVPVALHRAVRSQRPAVARFGPLLGLILILGVLPLAVGAVLGLDEGFLSAGGGAGLDDSEVLARVLVLAGWPAAELGLEVTDAVWLCVGRVGLAMVGVSLLALLGLGPAAKSRGKDPEKEGRHKGDSQPRGTG